MSIILTYLLIGIGFAFGVLVRNYTDPQNDYTPKQIAVAFASNIVMWPIGFVAIYLVKKGTHL